ncbi:MAG: PBP1A family penicillin-binding protein [Oscillospiraceae bacterium]|nr:PBP1A family penicillin-binding protein [Oscillospiraceae bacterium]
MSKTKRAKPRGRIIRGIFKAIGTCFLVGVLAMLVFACIFAVYVKTDLTSQLNLSMDGFSLDQTSMIYYQDQKTGDYLELQQLYGTENRIWASYEEIPKDLIFACVAIEDKRFYEHKGVDWLRTLKASANMFLGGSTTYGASTLTQQLIKNLTGEEEVTVRRKILEIFRALKFEQKYSKEMILEWYLNTIYLGEGCYGVKSAAQVYFGKELSELTLAECASLIGITNNPSIFDPYLNQKKNRERQETILAQMLEQGYIETEAEYDAAIAQKMVFQNTSGESQNDDTGSEYYSYFIDQVIRDVTADLSAATGYDDTIVSQMIRSGGYSIYTTIDLDVQSMVDAVYTDLTNIPGTTSEQQLQSAIVILDNETGDVKAIAGGVGEKTGSLTFSRATQSQLSPGSTIKPITVYAPALELGKINPATVYDDSPYTATGSSVWPKNSGGGYAGLTSIKSAVARSLNTVAVKVVSDLTPEYCYTFAKEKLGMAGLVSDVLINGASYTDVALSPLAMGSLTRGVSVLQMAQAYETFANQGTFRKARTYTKVLDADGNVILDNTQQEQQSMSETAAYYMTYMLKNAVETGTGYPARLDNMPVAGKTGTTDDDKDRWFVGYTPYYCAAVWCGYDDPEEVNLSSSSTNPSAYLWQKVMESVHAKLETKEFVQPSTMVSASYCLDSGLLATQWCQKDPRGSRVTSGLFSIYDVPTTYCTTHVEAQICEESNHIATEFCSLFEDTTFKSIGLLNVTRYFAKSGIVVGDQQYVVNSGTIPAGYFEALPNVTDAIALPCAIHTQESYDALLAEREAEKENENPTPELPPEGEFPLDFADGNNTIPSDEVQADLGAEE